MIEWANRHINWVWFIANILIPAIIAGIAYVFTWVALLTPLVYLAELFIWIATTTWLLDRKGRSMWFILLLLIPFGWIMLLYLKNIRGYEDVISDDQVLVKNKELENKYIFNPDEDDKRAWNEVLHDLVESGDVTVSALTDTQSILYWWRHTPTEKQIEISQKVEDLINKRKSIDIIEDN